MTSNHTRPKPSILIDYRTTTTTIDFFAEFPPSSIRHQTLYLLFSVIFSLFVFILFRLRTRDAVRSLASGAFLILDPNRVVFVPYLGVYGDVVRVKILFNKKDTALIQMAEPTQAHLAISHLDRTRLYGKTLRVNSSKHQVVQMPKEGHQVRGSVCFGWFVFSRYP